MDLLETVGYFDQGPIRGRPSRRDKYIRNELRDEIYSVLNPPILLPPTENEEESVDLQGEGILIIIPSNIVDIWTRLEVLLGLKLSGHTDNLTEASNLIDEFFRRGEILNEQQYRNALDNSKISVFFSFE